jgi:hypothetical protein
LRMGEGGICAPRWDITGIAVKIGIVGVLEIVGCCWMLLENYSPIKAVLLSGAE